MNEASQAVIVRAQQLKTRARIELDFPYFLRWCKIQAAEGEVYFKPYPYQDEAAHRWQRLFDLQEQTTFKQGEVGLKARQIGWSWLSAAFKYWVAAYHPNNHVAYFSVGERE